MTIKEQLNDFKGSQIIGLDTATTVKLRGGMKNPMQGRVRKVTEGSLVMLFKGSNGYSNMVNRRLAKQIDLTEDLLDQIGGREFTPGPRAWGHRIPGTPFVHHKDKDYLECIFLRAGKSKYFLNGEEIAKEEIQGLDQKVEGAQGGLRDKVIIRTYAMNSIIKIRKGQKEILGPSIVGA